MLPAFRESIDRKFKVLDSSCSLAAAFTIKGGLAKKFSSIIARTRTVVHQTVGGTEEAVECGLAESLWDASLFVGLNEQGVLCSMWTVMLILLNLVIQTSCTFIVIYELAKVSCIGYKQTCLADLLRIR